MCSSQSFAVSTASVSFLAFRARNPFPTLTDWTNGMSSSGGWSYTPITVLAVLPMETYQR